MKYMSRLESARGIAALMVLLFHASVESTFYYNRQVFSDFFSFGYSGVSFFFVLSGFLIMLAHRGDIGRPEKAGTYSVKRIIRIYPPYWIVFPCVATMYYLAKALTTAGRFTPVNIAQEALLVPLGTMSKGIMYVAWTLHLEVLFYIVFACLIINRTLGLLLLIFWQALVIARLCGVLQVPSFLDRFVHPGNLGFLLGIFAVLLLSFWRTIPAIWIVGSGLTVYAVSAWIDVHLHHPHILIYLLGSFLLVLGLARRDMETALSAPQLLRTVGAASYSIYLVHYPVLSILAKLCFRAGLLTRMPIELFFLLISGAGLAVGLAFHRLVEAPLLIMLRTMLLPRGSKVPS